jgi:lysosomal alpha-mannosidase
MDNLEAGWAFLQEHFGVRPHIGWQLDPFGYSAVTPSLLESYGFDALFVTRVGTQVKERLKSEGHLQFIWKGHNSQQGIFVSVNQGELYTVTHDLKYDVLTPNHEVGNRKNNSCKLEDILSDKLECLDYFVNDIVSTYLNTTDLHWEEGTTRYHIPALFGDDFAYTNASHNFLFINKLASLLEKHSLERFGV